MPIGDEIRRRRIAQGLSLEALADRSGLSPNYIGSLERGQRDPSLSTLEAVAIGLELEPAELLGGVGDLSAVGVELAQLVDELPPATQLALLELVRSLARPARTTLTPRRRTAGR
jgi:transcriptional regulator with XRE-family HTH domain